eukprot:tig00000254_g22565.t1
MASADAATPLLAATPAAPAAAAAAAGNPTSTRWAKVKFFVAVCCVACSIGGLLAGVKYFELQANRYVPPADPERADIPSGDGVLRFALLGDWGRKGSASQSAVAKAMGSVCAARRCDYVISVGDNFYNHGVSGIADAHWQLSFEQAYSHPSLNVTWLVALGNHDYFGGSVQAQLDYEGLRGPSGEQQRRWNLPARYYVRTVPVGDKRLSIFFLDTTPCVSLYRAPVVNRFMSDIMRASKSLLSSILFSQNPGDQYAWLEEALEASTADIKIVVGHHPIYSAGHHGDSADLLKHVKPLLEQYGVPLYISGHDHNLQHIVPKAAFQQLISGGGSSTGAYLGTRPELRWGDEGAGFMVLSVTPEGYMYVEAYGATGTLLYSTRLV